MLGLVQVLVKIMGEVWGKIVKPHISALGWEVVLALVELNQPSPKHCSPALSLATMGKQHPWVVSTPLSGSQAPPGLTLSISLGWVYLSSTGLGAAVTSGLGQGDTPQPCPNLSTSFPLVGVGLDLSPPLFCSMQCEVSYCLNLSLGTFSIQTCAP